MATKRKISNERLERIRSFARKFSKALEKDLWGDIDPNIFKYIASGKTDGVDEEMLEWMEGMIVVIDKSLDKSIEELTRY